MFAQFNGIVRYFRSYDKAKFIVSNCRLLCQDRTVGEFVV